MTTHNELTQILSYIVRLQETLALCTDRTTRAYYQGRIEGAEDVAQFLRKTSAK